MTKSLSVLAVPGSLRQASFNRSALVAAQLMQPDGMKIEIFDLEGIPIFNQDTEKKPVDRVVEFKRKIIESDAILIATPEYNYSIPGVLKNALDTASRPFGESAWTGKPVAILGASVSAFGTVRAQHHLRQVFVTLDMVAVNQPEVLISNAEKSFDQEGNLIDQTAQKLIRQLLNNLALLTHRLKV